MQCNIENVAMITIKHLQMNQISALNNQLGVDMPLNKKQNQTKPVNNYSQVWFDFDCNQTFTNESNFSIKYLNRTWYAVKQINQRKPNENFLSSLNF